MNVDKYVIGIDVGGTNTDAVLVRNDTIVRRYKETTTEDIKTGISNALKHLFEENQNIVNQISSINIGTTYLVNALIQRRGLNKPLVVRLGKPFSNACPPTIGWDTEARALVGKCHLIEGGYLYKLDEITPLKVDVIEELAREALKEGTTSVAITGIFSPIKRAQEILVGKIFKDVFKEANPSLGVSLSHQLGDLGLLGRENATIVNAMLFGPFNDLSQSIKQAVQEQRIVTNVYLTQGNGIKKRLDSISSNPLLTLHSGPINSVKGAARIANVQNAVVVDIGGTSTDVGIIDKGQPVNENCQTTDANITYSCTKPRINTIVLGGGTTIQVNEVDGRIEFHNSIRFELLKKALAFGGEILTPTDIAIALGRLEIPTGNPERVKEALLRELDEATLKKEQIYYRRAIALFFGITLKEVTFSHVKSFIEKVDDAIYIRLKSVILETIDSMEKIPENLVLVWGGVKLFDLDRLRLDFIEQQRKFRQLLIPENADVANALGAAISLLGATVKTFHHPEPNTNAADALETAVRKANERVTTMLIQQGAVPETILQISESTTPLSYLNNPPILVNVSAVGKDSGENGTPMEDEVNYDNLPDNPPSQGIQEKDEIKELIGNRLPFDRITLLTDNDINDMASGAGWLGSGGGADPENARLMILNVIKERPIRLVAMDDLPDEALVISFGGMGSPSVSYEQLFTEHEGIDTIIKIEEEINKSRGELGPIKKVDAILASEGAGENGLYPLYLAAKLGIPVIDADCKGRALPFSNMTTPCIYGKFDEILGVLSNGLSVEVVRKGNFMDFQKEARKITQDMGGVSTKAQLPLTGKQVKELTIKGTLSIVRQIGESIRSTQLLKFSQRLAVLNEVLAKTDYKEAKVVCEGKIVAFAPIEDGALRVGGFVVKDSNQNELFGIGFQNENLFVRKCSTQKNIAFMPELINVVDRNTFQIIHCESLKFGQDVAIVIMSPPKMLTGPEAEKVFPDKDTETDTELFPFAQHYTLLNRLFEKINSKK